MFMDLHNLDQNNDIKQNVKDCIFVILSTSLGERALKPEFGCNLKQYVFEPMNEATFSRMRNDIVYALNKWEYRISDISVNFYPNEVDGFLKVEISYKIQEDSDQLIYLLDR